MQTLTYITLCIYFIERIRHRLDQSVTPGGVLFLLVRQHEPLLYMLSSFKIRTQMRRNLHV